MSFASLLSEGQRRVSCTEFRAAMYEIGSEKCNPLLFERAAMPVVCALFRKSQTVVEDGYYAPP